MNRRREFLTLLGGAAASGLLSLGAHAQQTPRKRRLGILMPFPAADAEARARIAAFREALAAAGWSEDRNLQIEYRWAPQEDEKLVESSARELVELRPEVILTSGNSTTTLLGKLTKTIPIVFGSASVVTETGLIDNMAHPGGNVTGFTQLESSIAGKYLDLLREVQPQLSRVLIVQGRSTLRRSPAVRTILAIAMRLGVDASVAPPDDPTQLENSFAEFAANEGAKGLVALSSPINIARRQQIIALALKHRLPAIYPYRIFAVDGGLMSYGPDLIDQFRKAASYVDRILRGEKPGDLPVQAPTKFELIVNLNTAKAIGLAIPESFLLRADEVIE